MGVELGWSLVTAEPVEGLKVEVTFDLPLIIEPVDDFGCELNLLATVDLAVVFVLVPVPSLVLSFAFSSFVVFLVLLGLNNLSNSPIVSDAK